MVDRMRKAGRRQAMATVDGDGRGAWAPATEVRAKEAEMPSQLLVTPTAPSFHCCHTSLVLGLQHFQLIPPQDLCSCHFLQHECSPWRDVQLDRCQFFSPTLPRGCTLSLDSYPGW